jgi:hypothetical protein
VIRMCGKARLHVRSGSALARHYRSPGPEGAGVAGGGGGRKRGAPRFLAKELVHNGRPHVTAHCCFAVRPSGHMRAGPRSSVAAAMPRHVMHPIASENSSHRSSTVFVGYGTMRRSRRTSLKRTAVGARRVHRALVKAVAG